MRTTLNLDEQLVVDVVRMTGETSKSKAMARALEGYARAQRTTKLRAMLGNTDLDLNDWREFRNRERA